MRIALLHSTREAGTEPERECVVDALGMALAERGHDVTLLTGDRRRAPGGKACVITVVRCWAPPKLPIERHYEDHLTQVPSILWHLIRRPFDIAHAFFPAGAWAVVQARRIGGPPLVFSFDEDPDRHYLVARHYRLEMWRIVSDAARACTVQSNAAACSFERYLLRRPQVAPAAEPGHGPGSRALASWYEELYRAALT